MKELIMAETKIFADTSDIAKMLSVGVQTIRGWANQKKIPSMKLPNGKFIFDPAEVIAAVKNLTNLHYLYTLKQLKSPINV